MAINANQIDDTVAKVKSDMDKINTEIQIFETNYAGYNAGTKTAIKSYVQTFLTTQVTRLNDVIAAINALP